MSAAGTPFDLGAGWAAAGAPERRLALGPAEGWSSVALLVLMSALLGWSIDDAHWVLGDQSLTDFLPYAGALGVLWGVAAAKLGRGRIVTHGVGAILATFFIVFQTGSPLVAGWNLADIFRVTADHVFAAYRDLVLQARPTTAEISHFVLVLGAICWATGQFAGYAAFGHRRPLAAVVLPGTFLVVNVAITVQNQFPALVLYALAALLFLVRFHVADEQRTWSRHRIADTGNAVGLSLRAGLSFIAIAFVVSLGLTGVAASAPLADSWHGIDQRLIDLGNQLSRLFPAGGPGTRFTGAGFGDVVTVKGIWQSDATPEMTIQTATGAPLLKWRAAVYDNFDGSRWSRSDSVDVSVPAGTDLLAGTGDEPLDGVRYSTMSYTVRGSSGLFVGPGIPATVDRGARITLAKGGAETWLGVIHVDSGASYAATVQLPVYSDRIAGGITENRLRAAGTTSYPADLWALYTHLQPGTAGADIRGLLDTVMSRAQPRNPYDTARAIESYLQDGANFHYSANVLDVDCGGRGVADCFAWSKKGYCEHYATAMVVMLRLEKIPARFIEGYLPSKPDAGGVQTIRQSNRHAWVQAWFPGAGWVDFDPTGGGQGQPQAIPSGPPIPTATPGPTGAGASGPGRTRPPISDPGGDSGGSGTSSRSPGLGPAILLVFPAVGLVIFLAVLAFRRRKPRQVQPAVVYRTVAGIAGRLGHPRRPTQTVYEYLGALSDAVPIARPDLQLVARSTVETTYGRHRMPPDRLAALGRAQRRLRVALLRLVLRRGRPR